jgi:hypothetical protein
MGTKREATIDDLWHVEGKAELVNGELVLMPAAELAMAVPRFGSQPVSWSMRSPKPRLSHHRTTAL